MFYYKRVDDNGDVLSVTSSDTKLQIYDNLVSITEEEYNEIINSLPEPEPVDGDPTQEEDTAAMLIDHEYRLTLLELGINESEV